MRPLELAAHITILLLICLGVAAAIYLKCCRQRRKEESVAEEARVRTTNKSLDRITPVSSDLPLFKTRSSLSMSSSPTTTRTPRSPGIRFTITPPCRRNGRNGSIDSLPTVETVLEQYEREAEAAERSDKLEVEKILKGDEDLGEPGPSVVEEEEPLTQKESAWDRPHIAEKAREA